MVVDYTEIYKKLNVKQAAAQTDAAGASVNSSKNFQMPTMYANSSVGYTNTTGSMRSTSTR